MDEHNEVPAFEPSIFRAYDIRGRYPAEINEEAVRRIAGALALHLKPKTIVLGRDVRESGPALFRVARNEFVRAGITVYDIGLVPVDVYYFAVATLKADGGLFVSASHNPREWNGLNLARRKAEPISSETGLLTIRDLALAGKNLTGKQKGKVIKKDVLPAYNRFLKKWVKPRGMRKIKIVLNGSNGVSARTFRNFARFAKLPLTMVGLNEKPDGTFPKGSPNPLLPENRKEICALVKKTGAMLGIAWDSDGDRCFFVDENGEFLDGCFVIALLAKEILRQHPRATILTDTRLIWAVGDVVREGKGKLVISRPGMTIIPARMKKEHAIFGGEMSCHLYFKDTFYRDSGIVPALVMLELLNREGKTLAELAAPYRERVFVSSELNFIAEKKQEIIATIEELYKEGKRTYIDGLSAEFADWRFNLRASNTESLLRLNVEARSATTLEKERATLIAHIVRLGAEPH